MNFLSWLLALSVIIALMIQAVAFHKATVCRQEAWLKSTEMRTRALLHNPRLKDRDWHVGCRLLVVRDQEEITWRKLPSLIKYSFSLELKGHL
jgi:hypothetical protein